MTYIQRAGDDLNDVELEVERAKLCNDAACSRPLVMLQTRLWVFFFYIKPSVVLQDYHYTVHKDTSYTIMSNLCKNLLHCLWGTYYCVCVSVCVQGKDGQWERESWNPFILAHLPLKVKSYFHFFPLTINHSESTCNRLSEWNSPK